MSPMRLRDSIRVPLRYGENELDTPSQTPLRQADGDSSDEEWVQTSESKKPPSRKKRKPNIVPYDPNLPPAAFPSLERPHPGPAPKATEPRPRVRNSLASQQAGTRETQTLPIRNARAGQAASSGPSLLEGVPMDQLENYLASNNMANPTYARNVELARNAPLNPADATGHFDSDEELPDATQVLLDKIPNPTWNDLHPAMQVEIYENMMEDYNHYALHHVLGIGKPEHAKIMEYVGVRNKQVMRENKSLEKMRAKQRSTLMQLDNSDLRMFEPPPQLVLKRIMRETTRAMVNNHTSLMMCQSHDFLKARQYLHNRKLPRRYAGDWGDSLVALKEYEEDAPGPDKFEWMEELKFTPPPSQPTPAELQAVQRNADFINSFSMGAIAPSDLEQSDSYQGATQDWGKYFERGQDGLSWDATKPRRGGMVTLRVGRRNAEILRHYEMTGVMPRVAAPHGTMNPAHISQTVVPGGHVSQFGMPQITTPPVAVAQGSMAQFGMPHIGISQVGMAPFPMLQAGMHQGTASQFVASSGPNLPVGIVPAMVPPVAYPSMLVPQCFVPLHGQMPTQALPLPRPRERPPGARPRAMPSSSPSSGAGAIVLPNVPSPVGRLSARPISRRLHTDRLPESGVGGHVSSQARYQRQMARAHFERMEALKHAQTEQQSSTLPSRPARSAIDAEIPPQTPAEKPTEEAEEAQSSEISCWEEHKKIMSSDSVEDMMREFIQSHPPANKDRKSS